MVDCRMYVNVAIFVLTLLLVVLSPQVLLVVRKGDIEIKGLVALVESETDEGVLTAAVLDFENEVAGGVEGGFYGALALARKDEAGSEEFPGSGILEANLAAVAAGDDPEAARPDLVGLQPFPAFVPAASASRWDLVHYHFAHHQQRVFERFLILTIRRRRFNTPRRRHIVRRNLR